MFVINICKQSCMKGKILNFKIMYNDTSTKIKMLIEKEEFEKLIWHFIRNTVIIFIPYN